MIIGKGNKLSQHLYHVNTQTSQRADSQARTQFLKNNKGVNKDYGRQKTWVRPKRTKDLD